MVIVSKKDDFKNRKICNIPSINNFHPITILKIKKILRYIDYDNSSNH